MAGVAVAAGGLTFGLSFVGLHSWAAQGNPIGPAPHLLLIESVTAGQFLMGPKGFDISKKRGIVKVERK